MAIEICPPSPKTLQRMTERLALQRDNWDDRGFRTLYDASDEEIEAILALYDDYDNDGAVACEAFKGGDFAVELNRALKRVFDLTQERRKLFSLRTALFDAVDLCPVRD